MQAKRRTSNLVHWIADCCPYMLAATCQAQHVQGERSACLRDVTEISSNKYAALAAAAAAQCLPCPETSATCSETSTTCRACTPCTHTARSPTAGALRSVLITSRSGQRASQQKTDLAKPSVYRHRGADMICHRAA